MRQLPRRQGRGRDDVGAMTLSYVIIVPIFLVAIMTIAQISVWYLAKSAALAAARQGVDAARLRGASPGDGVAAARSFVHTSAKGFLLNPAVNAGASTATTIVITVSGNAPSLVPMLPISVSQVAAAPVERFTAP